MADFGPRASKFPDDLGVDFGEGEKDFLEELGLGETDLVRIGTGRGDVKFDMDAARMQCK